MNAHAILRNENELWAATEDGKSIKGNINFIATVGNYIYVNTQGEGIYRYDTKTKKLIYKHLGKFMMVKYCT